MKGHKDTAKTLDIIRHDDGKTLTESNAHSALVTNIRQDKSSSFLHLRLSSLLRNLICIARV